MELKGMHFPMSKHFTGLNNQDEASFLELIYFKINWFKINNIFM